MSKSDDDKLTFRDQVALRVMQTLIGKSKDQEANTDNGLYQTYIVYGKFDNYGFEKYDDYFDRLDKKTERIAEVAYRIADLMRKARLKVFE